MKQELAYLDLPADVQERISADRAAGIVPNMATPNSAACRRLPRPSDAPRLYRPPFSKDADKILNCLFFNRYTDKTQVFSFYRNDDISRRALHVQLVSRIARNIGAVLGLNLDLIEAIAIGHDIGHTPFGHAGEHALNELYRAYTGRSFRHNLHSARVLDTIVPLNITLQTLDGIISHNGKMPRGEYAPVPMGTFADFDARVQKALLDAEEDKSMVPCTLEGCLVRICDILAYVGKDRQDAVRARLIPSDEIFAPTPAGSVNAQIINNFTVNLIANSYGKPYLKLDDEYADALKQLKRENFEMIYMKEQVQKQITESVVPMMSEMYKQIRADAAAHNQDSCLYRHHIAAVEDKRRFYPAEIPYADCDPDDLTVDFIAAMTDDYFVDYYNTLFPHSSLRISYIGYFDV